MNALRKKYHPIKNRKFNHSQGYSYVYRKHRCKADWAGTSLGDAFKHNLDYSLRLSAQRSFYQAVKKAQMAAARAAGKSDGAEFVPRAIPQLGPCYSTYPSTLSAYAAIGLTAFLEFEERVKEKALLLYLGHYLADPAKADQVNVDKEIYSKVAMIVAEAVQKRLVLESLSRWSTMSSVEIYRLFSASKQDLRFNALSDMIRFVVLYGDVMPDRKKLDLHNVTASAIDNLMNVSIPFFQKIAHAQESEFIQIGVDWVKAICNKLSERLPGPEEEIKQIPTNEIAPLNTPVHPRIFDITDAADQTTNTFVIKQTDMEANGSSEHESGRKQHVLDEESAKIVEDFAGTIQKAGGQSREWEDMRSDIVERKLSASVFKEGPVKGTPADGHEITVQIGRDPEVSGEIFDRQIELSDDLPAYEELLKESGPVTRALKRGLYPNVREEFVTRRFENSGIIDPARLPLAGISPAIFRRYRIAEHADKRGHPLLVIACDGSGSLDFNQMKMLKILASGWLNSTAGSGIHVLAGLYHSGHIRADISGPLVQWIYHPYKTPAISRHDAARALVSLPLSGTGAQSDALSIAFILNEAKQIARGNMIYLILITDTQWNRSFNTDMDGEEEVSSYFTGVYEEFKDKLHTTLVALGVSEETGFEGIVEKVIRVSDKELLDYAVVAEKIGTYVATCIKDQRRLKAGHKGTL